MAPTGTGVEEARKWHRFNALDFGVVGDGKANDGPAFQKAIDAATASGGGMVYVPPGQYLSGPIELKANVNFHVEAGAVITGSARREDYLSLGEDSASHGERGSARRSACLIYAQDAPNVALSGRGRIDGNGLAFCVKKDGRNVIGEWRPGKMIKLVRCENLRIEDITLTNAPGWTVHPIDCEGMVIRGITILNGLGDEDHVPNADGIDPDGCCNARISDCYVQSGDDSIVLKITPASRLRRCSNVTVTNCVCVSTETALKIGSESYGEFRNITFSNCAIRDAGCGVGIWMRDGGLIDGFLVDNVSMTLPHDGVPVYLWSWRREDGTPWGRVRNVMISNVSATGDACAFLSGVKEMPLEGVTLENVRLFMRGGTREKFHADPPYPFQVWGHRRAPYDIYCRYVNDLKLRNVKITWGEPEKPLWGSAIRCQGVSGLEIAGLEARQALGSDAPVIRLKDVHGAFIHNCQAPAQSGTFLRLEEGTTGVTLMNNDLHQAKMAAELAPGVASGELFQSANRLP